MMTDGRRILVLLGLVLTVALFLLGQEAWPPCTDGDGDGYGDPASLSCTYPALDCDDTDPAVNPGAIEGPEGDPTCSDGLDNDCDGNPDTLDTGCLATEALVADHLAAAAFNDIPDTYIEQAKDLFKMTYGHTSHGSQIVSGMGVLEASDALYAFFDDHYYYRFGPPNPIAPAGNLSLWDTVPGGDLGNPDRVTWKSLTEVMLTNSGGDYTIYPHFRNLVMWSWCGQVSSASEADINTYLSLMEELETAFPDVTFVYMTGHLDGGGETGNLHLRNEQIRAYCIANDKVLFDFADIESYDPSGNYFLDLGANDACDYSGGNWADQWCAANPGSDLCAATSCAHSRALNCNLKARAFWWMMARLAGWDGA